MSEFVMANRIKTMRLKCNLTMEELGSRLGVGKSAVNKWEKGLVKNIKRSTIEQMAKIFDCSPIWLMGMDEEIAAYDTAYDFERDWALRGGGEHPIHLTSEEEQIIQDIRKADNQTREMLRRILYPGNTQGTTTLNAIPVLEKIQLKQPIEHIPYLGDNLPVKKVAKIKKKKDELA